MITIKEGVLKVEINRYGEVIFDYNPCEKCKAIKNNLCACEDCEGPQYVSTHIEVLKKVIKLYDKKKK